MQPTETPSASPQRHAGDLLEAAREAAGLSLRIAALRLYDRLGEHVAISGQHIRNYELGKVTEDRWDVLNIKALCDIYEVDLESVSPVAAEAWQEIQPKLLAVARNPRKAGIAGASEGSAAASKSTADNPRYDDNVAQVGHVELDKELVAA